jgi:hypothetical protein
MSLRVPTASPPTLSTLVEREGKEDQCPSDAKEDKTDSIDLNPPAPGEPPPGETLSLALDTSIVGRGCDRENTQLLGLDVRPEKHHQGGRHNRGHDDLRSRRKNDQRKVGSISQRHSPRTSRIPTASHPLRDHQRCTRYYCALARFFGGWINSCAYEMNALTI